MDNHIEIVHAGTIKLRIVSHEDHSTLVEITDSNHKLSARGNAKWNPTDFYDREIGVGLATGRALQKYGRKLENYFNSLSETEAQHRGRLKIEKRQEKFIDNILKLDDLMRKQEIKARKDAAKTMMQALTGQPVVETESPKNAAKTSKSKD